MAPQADARLVILFRGVSAPPCPGAGVLKGETPISQAYSSTQRERRTLGGACRCETGSYLR